MDKKVQIVKIGGDIVDNPDLLDQLLGSIAVLRHPRILVHGGGILLNSLAKRMSIPVKMVDGRRITDSDTLDLALMVYSGLINTKIVARLQALKCQAVGLSGADGGVVRAIKRPVKSIDYGLVGDITRINADYLILLIQSGFVPVQCALSCDENGQMLNTNADTIAAEISIALAIAYEVQLTYVLDQPGVLANVENPDSLIDKLDIFQYNELKEKNRITGGMLPKLHNGFYALEKDVSSVNITNISDISNQSGTLLESDKE